MAHINIRLLRQSRGPHLVVLRMDLRVVAGCWYILVLKPNTRWSPEIMGCRIFKFLRASVHILDSRAIFRMHMERYVSATIPLPAY